MAAPSGQPQERLKKVNSICGMCTVRCPIEVHVKDGEAVYIQGSPHHPAMNGSLCPRGGAGLALLHDNERPQGPLIREGKRGEGRWRRATWEEAYTHIADKLTEIVTHYGGRSILYTNRGGPWQDIQKAFVRGLGSPNYTNHDASCARNVMHAAKSFMGMGRKDVTYDLKNAKHVVLQTRNMFEAINVSEVNNLISSLNNGGKLTVIDVRATISASKANNFFLVRPGSDYAFNLALIHTLIKKDLYHKNYVKRIFKDFDKLAAFVEPYSPDWAESETGIPAGRVESLAGQLAEAAPAVIWHPGWHQARYLNSFYVCRTAYIINGLLGSIGAKGGLAITNKAKDVGRKGLKSFVDLLPAPEDQRADGLGWKYKHFDAGPGLLQLQLKAIETEEPYPVKAYICYRHDPLMAMPDPEKIKKILDKLDLLVSITFTWSETANYADVVLPLSTYLERESTLAHKGGLKPYFFVRQRAVQPRFDSKAPWEIYTDLARHLNIEPLARFRSIEEMWAYQLEGTGVEIADFEAKGMVSLTDKPKYRTLDELKFPTPSGKLEVISEKWEKAGLPSLLPYQPLQAPPEGQYRITFGRCALHTQGHTVNNPLLSEVMGENELWINRNEAARLGIGDGEYVEVSNNGQAGQRIKAKVTEAIHPECVFMLHGFGHRLKMESRAFGKGAADQELMIGGLEKWDPAGGAMALQEHFVTVRKLEG